MTRKLLLGVLPLAACLYTGNGTMGLPCNTDLECGGDQLCVEYVCGGPADVGSSSSGASSESSSDGGVAAGTDDGVRDMCEPSDSECLDDHTLRLCTDDGKLSTRDCKGWCGEASPSDGCFTPPDGSGDTCYCEAAREPCSAAEGFFECLDGYNLRTCTDGWWDPMDCDTVCVDAGYSGADSCGPGDQNDTCFCNNACVEGAIRCVDGDTAAQCSGGSWTIYDCNDVCIENGKSFSPGCDFFYESQTEACGCV